MGELDSAIKGAENPTSKLGRLAKLLEDSEIPIEEIGRIDKVRIGTHETAIKVRELDEESGELIDRVEIVKQRADSLLLTPSWDTGPQWPLIEQPAPVKMTAPRLAKPTRDHSFAAIIPDVQFGFRLHTTDDPSVLDLDAFHDETALWLCLQLIRKTQPDLVVILGDFIDAPAWSKYEQEPSFQRTTQPTLDRAYRFLAELRAIVPDAEIRLIEGNHDVRVQKSIIKNASEAFGLRRACVPKEWPVMSIPFLLRLDELGIEYIGGYPAGITWINDNLACIHGLKVRSSSSTAKAVVDDERVSTIFGHVHRLETEYKTVRTRHGEKTRFAASAGCLCKIDGSVPSMKSGIDPLGRPLQSWENWQQGMMFVDYMPGDGAYNLNPVYINRGSAWFWGERYQYEGNVDEAGD